MGLLYRLHTIVKCVCGEGFGSNDYMTKVQSFPMGGHYRMDIISGMDHLRLDSVVPLVLCMVVRNC
jgi:hypothetical protein